MIGFQLKIINTENDNNGPSYLRQSKVSKEDLKRAELSEAKMPKTSSKLPTAEAVTEEVGSGVSELYQR